MDNTFIVTGRLSVELRMSKNEIHRVGGARGGCDGWSMQQRARIAPDGLRGSLGGGHERSPGIAHVLNHEINLTSVARRASEVDGR